MGASSLVSFVLALDDARLGLSLVITEKQEKHFPFFFLVYPKAARHRVHTQGKTYDELFETMKFDTFLSAEEAVNLGLADEVITKR